MTKDKLLAPLRRAAQAVKSFMLHRSLMWKTMSGIVFFILLLAAVNNLATWYAVSSTLDQNFDNELAIKNNAIGSSINVKTQRTIRQVGAAADNPDTKLLFYKAEEQPLTDHLDILKQTTNVPGYVAMSAGGALLCTSYPALQTDSAQLMLTKLAEDVENHGGELNGYALFSQLGFCAFAARSIVYNEQLAGVLILIAEPFDEFVDEVKSEQGVECTIFEGDMRAATTLLNTAGERATGTRLDNQDIVQKCLIDGEVYIGANKILGNNYLTLYRPITTYDGQRQGMLFLGMDTCVRNHLLRNIFALIVISLVPVLALVLFFFYRMVRDMICRPLSAIEQHTHTLAQGQLNVPAPLYNTHDEIDSLSHSVANMQEKLSNVMREIVANAAELDQASQELGHGSQQVSDGANDQAASLEEIASSMEQMGANMKLSMDNAQHSDKRMREMRDSIMAMAEQSQAHAKSVGAISDSVDQIKHMAQETNILSLNASVEAAKAGSHGGGFSVVAKEVGDLAHNTGSAAASINRTATDAIRGIKQINKVMQAAVPGLNEVVGLMDEIRTAAVEQDAGASQINSALADLNQLTQTNAAEAEHMAAQSQKLGELSKRMSQTVSKFQL